MRRSVKLLSNFFGATKGLTKEFVKLAGITDDELNQLRMSLMARPDRKATAKLLSGKGLSSRQIAEITGWDHATIARDLSVANATKTVANATDTPAATNSAATRERRAQVAEAATEGGVTDAPEQKTYRILYADPPWDYGAHLQPDYHPEQRDHYPVMSLDAICALPVRDWIESNAVLFLWVTSPILEKSFRVIDAWGFEYKTSFVWDKIKHNMGHYNSVRHEFLLVCVRGSCPPDSQQLIDSVQSIERGRHSAKPIEFYDIIETLYTHGEKLELFARDHRDGWDVYGHINDLREAAE